MLLDATELVTEQDKRIAGLRPRGRQGMIIIVNKWDLIEKDSKTINRFEEQIRQQMGISPVRARSCSSLPRQANGFTTSSSCASTWRTSTP